MNTRPKADVEKDRMVGDTTADARSLPALSANRRISETCDRFEEALRAEQAVKIEQFLGETPDPERTDLLRELIRLEAEYRLRDYIKRFSLPQPVLADWLKVATNYQPANSDTPSLPDGYENLGKLGEGATGAVYKARHAVAGHTIAFKCLRFGPDATESARKQLLRDIQTLTKVNHANIVQILHVGEDYFTMKYIAGESLESVVQRGPVESRRAAEWMVIIARAVHHAHERGFLHRDLKPSNILLDEAGQPHVADFGLARPLDGQTGETQSGMIIGTPPYMPPEQAAGKSRDLTAAADVYGLGAVLYALLTGRPPFQGANPVDTIQQVLGRKRPALPRMVNADVDEDLETICLLCLEKDPAKRYYKSAEKLAQDLERYLAKRPIEGRQPSWARSLWERVTDQHFVDPPTWGAISLWCVAIVWIGNTVSDVLVRLNMPVSYHALNPLAANVMLAGLLYYYLGRRAAALTLSERHIVVVIIALQLSTIVIWLSAGAPSDDKMLDLYPLLTILFGMTYFLQGSLYWGRYYLISLAWFGLGVAMPHFREWGPYAFSVLFTVTIGPVGWHLLRVRSPESTNQDG